EAISRLSQLREELKEAINADADAFSAVMAAYKAAKESSDGTAIIDVALQQATRVPLGVAERAREVLQIAESLISVTSPHMKSDLITSAALARAAIEGALANVEVNLESLKDSEFVAQMRQRRSALG